MRILGFGIGIGIEGLHEVNLTDTDHVGKLDAFASGNFATRPAEAKTAVIVAILDLIVLLIRLTPTLVSVVDGLGVLTTDLIGMPVAAEESEPVFVGSCYTGHVITEEGAQKYCIFIFSVFMLHLDAVGFTVDGVVHARQRSLVVVTDHDVTPDTGIHRYSLIVCILQRVNDTGCDIALGFNTCCHAYAVLIRAILGIQIFSGATVHLEGSNETCTRTIALVGG